VEAHLDTRDEIGTETQSDGPAPRDVYVNAEDLFYWMEEPGAADIPLGALWIDVPTGCRFCC
jgi:hypothetical protein